MENTENKQESKIDVNVSFEQQIENEINSKNLNAPRVKKEDIDILFSKLQFTLGRISDTRILCTATLDGFIIADGSGFVVDAKNYDEEIGKKIAHRKCALAAYDKLWEFEGYRLSRSIAENKHSENAPADQAVS